MRIILSALILTLAACSNPFGKSSDVDPGHTPGNQGSSSSTQIHKASPGSEMASVSLQNKTTSRGYVYSHSMGEMTHEVRSVTPRGYVLMSNVQGFLIQE